MNVESSRQGNLRSSLRCETRLLNNGVHEVTQCIYIYIYIYIYTHTNNSSEQGYEFWRICEQSYTLMYLLYVAKVKTKTSLICV